MAAGMAAADWPDLAWALAQRRDSRDWLALDLAPASGLRRLWSANVGQSYAAVSVQGSRVYAIGARDGKETVTCPGHRDGGCSSGAIPGRTRSATPPMIPIRPQALPLPSSLESGSWHLAAKGSPSACRQTTESFCGSGTWQRNREQACPLRLRQLTGGLKRPGRL